MLPHHIHLIGIGGAGMAGLASYLLETGRIVSGSELTRSDTTDRLAASGASIVYGHAAVQIAGAGLVVATDAIPADNVELIAARDLGIPILRRAECLDRLGEGRRALLVAGSHGKSTTAAMIACVLETAGLQPGFVIGADVPCLGHVRARVGGGAFFVAEACEAFRNLESLTPSIAVITNIDDEHINHYASQAALDASFADFAQRSRFVIVSGEDAGVARIRPAMGNVTSFGLDPACDVSAEPGPAPFIVRLGGEVVGPVTLALPGDHMRRNALAAIATCRAAGLPFDVIARGLGHFTGVARRWQEAGTAAGVRIVDDYAHHPAEIAATLRAARHSAPGRRLVAAFQPLLHSRVLRLHDAFADSLSLADHVLLLEVDSAGEAGTSGASAIIAEGLRGRGTNVAMRDDADELVERAPSDLQPGDLLLLMGGNRLGGVAGRIHRRLSEAVTPHTPPARARGWVSRLTGVFWAPVTFVGLFRTAVRDGPGRPALIDPRQTMSYSMLDAASDAVACGLAEQGLVGCVVGVSLPLSSDLIVAMLGVMKAGATYLPLDASLPEARMRFMLERTGARALITRDAASHGVPPLSLAELRKTPGQAPGGPGSTHDAYICFTSGTTGYPKGIRVGHAALFALLRDVVPRFGIGPDARMLLNTSISFDVSLAEICSTLAGGAALVVGGVRTLVGERLAEALATCAITHLSVTPTVLASVGPRPIPALGCIIACGEPCPAELVQVWAPGRRFFNVYGPTEATIYATAAPCYGDAPVTIGSALSHVSAHVLDAALVPVPTGEIGELCLSGPGVAAGYIDQPEETAARFVQVAQGRVYRTGDMVRRGLDGALQFIGRVDSQVKIRGNRVELEEIERIMLRQPGIADAAACVTTGESSSLICFVVLAPGCTLEATALLDRLADWLPGSAVPSHIVPVTAMPLTPSGKKDRRRLLTEQRVRIVTRASDFTPPRTETESQLATIWRDVLKLECDVGMFDRFTALGGDSLTGLILVVTIEKAFAVTIPPGYFGRLSTVPHMAVQLEDLLWHRAGRASVTDGFRQSRVYHRLRDLCGHWTGIRVDPESLISTLGDRDATRDIFLCCQEEQEFLSLGQRLPHGFRLHAMRSGHLVIDQGPASLRQVSAHYADEIEQISPGGTLVLAGICQGGTIAQMVAETLAARGWAVDLLALIEPGRPRPYTGAAALFYAEDSFLNPLRPGGSGMASFDAALAQGYSIDTVPGGHGGVCSEPAVPFLADYLVRRVESLAARPGAVS